MSRRILLLTEDESTVAVATTRQFRIWQPGKEIVTLMSGGDGFYSVDFFLRKNKIRLSNNLMGRNR